MFHKDAIIQRFSTYAQIDTQSDPDSPTCPSTEKQKNLGRLLEQELKDMGLQSVEMDENGYVYATLPSNSAKTVPVVFFCSHMDTSPDCSGTHVKPVVHSNYDGRDLVLPADPTQVIRMAEHPDLAGQMGNDIITADGTTLLGADNKAGIAAIMEAFQYLVKHPEIPHGELRVLFTPDEEIGRGVDKVNLQKVNAYCGYTLDGETLGTIEGETFSADGVTLTLHGVSTHPGFGKGKLENSMKIGADILAALPKDTLSPETTEGKEGFVHPVSISGLLEKTVVKFIIRDFTVDRLHAHEAYLESVVKQAIARYPHSTYTFEVQEQYRNMKEVLDKHPEVTAHAVEAMKRAGMNPEPRSIRGGTDGSRLSFMGLPCPNLFAGEHAFHSKLEWVSAQDMMKAAETVVHLAQVWEERA
ncbi:MAG: peptidase T [Bacteroidetes bacterium]|nr:peptidase T [Bacteroidota bacterium]